MQKHISRKKKVHPLLSKRTAPSQHRNCICDPPVSLYLNCQENTPLLHKIINMLQFVFPATSKFSFRSSHAYNQLFPIYCVSLFSITNKLLDDLIQNKTICMLMLSTVRTREMGGINMYPSSCRQVGGKGSIYCSFRGIKKNKQPFKYFSKNTLKKKTLFKTVTIGQDDVKVKKKKLK